MTNDRRVYCIGETVLDIIFQDYLPITAIPGGSMLNSAVSLGRSGIPVYFISDYAKDHAGDLVNIFLLKNGISTEYISRYSGGKTTLALAFLDHHQNADYSFYKILPKDRLTNSFPLVQPGDIILFGSFYALTKPLRRKIMEFIQSAKSNDAFIIYDPNFRTAYLSELETLRPWIVENIGIANLVRGSDEDFRYIFNTSNANEAYHYVSRAGCPLLVYTRNSLGVEVITAGHSKSYSVPKIQAVSTIGAGDSFNAGIIYALLHEDESVVGFTESSWERIINHGIRFSANVCQSLDNYISVDFGSQLKNIRTGHE